MVTIMSCDQHGPPPRIDVITVVEAFVKTVRCDYARLSILPDAATVITLLPGVVEDYNEVSPALRLEIPVPPVLF